MKKVIAGWLNRRSPEQVYPSLCASSEVNDYVGFETTNAVCLTRYMIINYKGLHLAVRPLGWYVELQEEAEGNYFIFETANELLEWMKH